MVRYQCNYICMTNFFQKMSSNNFIDDVGKIFIKYNIDILYIMWLQAFLCLLGNLYNRL
jgi:hypothetical protein